MRRHILHIVAAIILAYPLMAENIPPQDSKARVRLGLEYFQTPEMEYLTIKVTGRLEKKYEPVEGIGVSIYLGDASEGSLLGKTETDVNGQGIFELKSDKYRTISDELQELNFYAVLDSSTIYQDATEELTIRKVVMSLENIDQDSIKMVRVNISEMDSSDINVPQERVILKFYIERPLGNLPVGDVLNRTDEQGNVTIDFPTDIPGDSEGNVNLLVKIEENEKYGNIENSVILKWGIPTQIDHAELKRSLWASGANAPISLLILINSLILAVWGTILYIILRIYKISKL